MHTYAQVVDAEICNAISFSVFETLHHATRSKFPYMPLEKSSEKLNMRYLLSLYLANIFVAMLLKSAFEG